MYKKHDVSQVGPNFGKIAPSFCLFFNTVVPVFLVVHVCRTMDRVVVHPQPRLSGIGVPFVSLPGPTGVP